MAFLILFSFIACIIFAIAAFMAVVRGWCLTYLWKWFIIPVFPGTTQLTVYSAVGLCLVLGFLFPIPGTSGSKDKKESRTEIFIHTSAPLISLFIGWLVHTYFG